MPRRVDWNRREFIQALAGGSGLLLIQAGALAADGPGGDYDWESHRWGFAIDTTRCIGCNACMRACRAENDVPVGYHRNWVERYQITHAGEVLIDVATDDAHLFVEDAADVARSFFLPKICNHCEESVCVQVCPVGASFFTKDGVALIDEKQCVGCGYCVQACPYGTRFLNPETHVANKCTMCYHRITKGMVPACVEACPREARVFGDLRDPASRISKLLSERVPVTLKPELGTKPKCYYFGLDPEAV